MGARSKRASTVRTSGEFDVVRMMANLMPPKTSGSSVFSWSLEDIYTARNEQLCGSFTRPARMAESMRTNAAIAVAYQNRMAPQRCIPVEIVPAQGARGNAIGAEADALFGAKGIGVRPETLATINSYLVDHGVAFGMNVAVPREDGSRVDFEHKAWPIEHVKWWPQERCFKTLTEDGFLEPMIHGDGRWVIYKKYQIDPWKQEAAILPACLVWAQHAFAIRDWAKGSVAHGSAKVIGEMPTGVPLQSSDGALTPEAGAFLALLRSIASGDAPVGIRPAGSKTEFLTNTSTAWQVWSELSSNAEKASARIYLGTDGILGSQGGAPGVDIQSLFGVAATAVEGDLRAIERGFFSGVMQPWAAVNFGDSSLAPTRCYQMPDKNEDAKRASIAMRNESFFARISAARQNGFVIDQAYVDLCARECGITAPVLGATAPAIGPTAPAPSAPPTL